jgi:hypothetical protein
MSGESSHPDFAARFGFHSHVLRPFIFFSQFVHLELGRAGHEQSFMSEPVNSDSTFDLSIPLNCFVFYV